MKTKETSKLAILSKNDIDEITKFANKKRHVPLIKSTQVNVQIDKSSLTKIKILAKRSGVPYTTFMAKLLIEDVNRIWMILNKS